MSQKLNLIIFAASVLIGIIVRTFMLVFTVDYNSGFIKSEYTALVICISVILFIAALLVFFSSFFKNKKTLKVKLPVNYIFGTAEILMAAAIIYEAFFSVLLNYIQGAQFTLHKVTSLVSAAALIYVCVSRFTGREYFKIITIIPVLFWITRVITVFTEFATLATVSDTILETISMCLALVVFLNYSKSQCKIEVKSEKLNYATALLCGYFCAISSVPRFVCALITPNAFDYFANIPALTTFAAAVFATVIVLNKD